MQPLWLRTNRQTGGNFSTREILPPEWRVCARMHCASCMRSARTLRECVDCALTWCNRTARFGRDAGDTELLVRSSCRHEVHVTPSKLVVLGLLCLAGFTACRAEVPSNAFYCDEATACPNAFVCVMGNRCVRERDVAALGQAGNAAPTQNSGSVLGSAGKESVAGTESRGPGAGTAANSGGAAGLSRGNAGTAALAGTSGAAGKAGSTALAGTGATAGTTALAGTSGSAGNAGSAGHSGSGSLAGAGAGGSGPPAVCTVDETTCDDTGSKTLKCSPAGQWLPGTDCPFICNESTGSCGGVCKPNAEDCVGRTPRTCKPDGSGWQTGTITAKKCDATCTPGEKATCVTGDPVPKVCSPQGDRQDGVITIGSCGADCIPGTTPPQCVPGTNKQSVCTRAAKLEQVITPGDCGACFSVGDYECLDDSPGRRRTCVTGQVWKEEVVAGTCQADCTPGQSVCGGYWDSNRTPGECAADTSSCAFAWSEPGVVYLGVCTANGKWDRSHFCPNRCTSASTGQTFFECTRIGALASCSGTNNCSAVP
jgi:hypothetical protein